MTDNDFQFEQTRPASVILCDGAEKNRLPFPTGEKGYSVTELPIFVLRRINVNIIYNSKYRLPTYQGIANSRNRRLPIQPTIALLEVC